MKIGTKGRNQSTKERVREKLSRSWWHTRWKKRETSTEERILDHGAIPNSKDKKTQNWAAHNSKSTVAHSKFDCALCIYSLKEMTATTTTDDAINPTSQPISLF